MAFTVNDYHDLVELLEQHPDWRSELRRLLLTDDILNLPRIVSELAEAQKRTEARVEELVDAQKRTVTHIDLLVEAQKRTEETLKRLVGDVSELKGWHTQWRFREYAFSYFGRWLRKAQVISLMDLKVDDAYYEEGKLSDAEYRELLALDMLLRGHIGKGENARDVVVAVEVSYVIDKDDVERAHRRAELLRRLGFDAIGAVGGQGSLGDAEERARKLGLILTVDGRSEFTPQN